MAVPGGGVPGYVALGHWGTGTTDLDSRLELLIAQLSAELSACCWCIEQGRHRWRKARLPIGLLNHLRTYRTSTVFSERECAALLLAEAVAHYTERDSAAADEPLTLARRYFAEHEVARIAQLAAGEHFFDPGTGAVGRDVRGELVAGSTEPGGESHAGETPPGGGIPWSSISSGIRVRGWS